MNDNQIHNKRYETVGWGVLFLLIGGLNLIPGNQDDFFVLGVGIILLGLNLARALSKIPISAITITLGIMACLLGMTAVLRQPLNLPHFELPFFATLMIVIGVVLLARASRPAAGGWGRRHIP